MRSDWSALPASVRARIDEVAGSAVVSTHNLSGGFSPGPAVRCDLVDGRKVFVKAAGTSPNPDSPRFHRSEADVLASLPQEHPSPHLIGFVDDGDWVALVVEWVEGRMPTAPLDAADVDRFLRLAERLAEVGRGLRPAGVRAFADRHAGLTGHWAAMCDDADGTADRADDWSRRHMERLAVLEAGTLTASTGDSLLQLDFRTDNVLFVGDDAADDIVVDWPNACLGAPWIDLVGGLPALRLDGGPEPEACFAAHPLGRAAEPDAVTAFLAAITGFFTRLALLPPPPGLPTLRAFQAAQGREARRWLRLRTGLR